MNEFAINWLKGGEYAEITVPSGSALESKLLKYSQERPDEVSHVIINKDGSMVCHAPVSYIHVKVYCLPDDNFCLADENHRSP